MQSAPEDVSELRSAPKDVRKLRNAWESQVGQVKGLTWELEQDFRFGQQVTRTDQGYVMGGTMKGGSSSMWYPTGRDEYHAFKRWQRVEGIQEARDDEAFARFAKLAEQHSIELVTRRHAPTPMRRSKADGSAFQGYGPVYGDMTDILECLPASHLDRKELARIQLGGWGPDAAKASAFLDDAVLMYDFAVRGARRTFLGLFLHELGHAHEVALSEAQKDAIYQGYQVLGDEDAFIGIEFLVDGNTRKLYQRFVFQEFLAETYMIYVACGQGLRDQIQRFGRRPREAWEAVYKVFRESFDGIEYE